MKIAALLLALLGAVQDDLDKRITALIAELRSEDISVREKATKELMTLEVVALPALEKAHSSAEGEVRARLGLAVDKLRREVKLLKQAPPIRLVSVSAKDRPLKEFLDDVGRQAGVSCEFDPAVANLSVTVEAKGEPLLKVLDRACRARAGLSFEIAKGKLRMVPGNHPDVPTAYAGPYRARLMRIAACKENDTALYFRFDAQPDQAYLSVTGSGATPLEGFAIRPASQVPMTTWMIFGKSDLTIRLGDVPVSMKEEDDLGGIFLVRRDKGDSKSLEALRFRARFLFALDSTPAELSLTEKGRALSVGDYYCNFRGPRFFVQREEASPRIMRPLLGELVDLNSFAVTDAAGKKFRLLGKGLLVGFPYEPRFQFLAEEEWKGQAVKLEYNVYTLADREIEFELKEVKLRD